MTYLTDLDAVFLLDHFSRHPWGCVEALKPFLGPFFPRKLLINMLVTLIGENSASESAEKAHFEKSPFLGVQHQIMVLEHYINTHKAQNTF